MRHVGYAYLCETLPISAVPLKRWAQVQPATRITPIGDRLAVPPHAAPTEDSLLAHALFALKHEGVQLDILAQALPLIAAESMHAELQRTPNGIYIRKACFLWEAFTGNTLEHGVRVGGAVQPLFDPDRYVTGPAVRNARWRIDFNGLGTLQYCATVERTAAIRELLDLDILGRARAFMATLPAEILDRAINWAYLHETRDSFAIERESPSEDKARRFIQLLRQAHERRELTEEYLVELQNSVVANPLDRAFMFRHEQNHLHSGLRGAAGVSYVPPPVDLCRELMQELMRFANEAPLHVDPLVAAGIVSFGFVFLHPFMDGNGRLSRFLIHQTLCRSGAMENGLLLPVSVAMKRQEQDYLAALKTFSQPAREFWEVTWLDAENMAFTFTGHPALYRYWDATRCVEFTLQMAKRALETELREETLFLERYDCLVKLTDERFDIRGSDLSRLVMLCLDNHGIVSRNRRKQFQYTVPDAAFDFLEEQARLLLAPPEDEETIEPEGSQEQ